MDDDGGTRTISDSRPEDGEIVTLELDPRPDARPTLRHIVVDNPADGLAHFYPSWSPDERWLVMAAAPRGTSAYTATTARLRLASADVDGQRCPGATCFDLARASQGTAVSSTWPKLSPFSQENDQLLFVTFSSKIDYGFALVNTGPTGAAPRSALDGGDRPAQRVGRAAIRRCRRSGSRSRTSPRPTTCRSGRRRSPARPTASPTPTAATDEVCEGGACKVVVP